MSHTQDILPVPDADSAPFWEGCKHHKLLIQRCSDCGAFRFPPASKCPACWSNQNTWVLSRGKGKVYSWIVVVHPVLRELYASKVPYVVALVELEEGVWIFTNIVDRDPHSIVANLPVEVVFEEINFNLTFFKFWPIQSSAAKNH